MGPLSGRFGMADLRTRDPSVMLCWRMAFQGRTLQWAGFSVSSFAKVVLLGWCVCPGQRVIFCGRDRAWRELLRIGGSAVCGFHSPSRFPGVWPQLRFLAQGPGRASGPRFGVLLQTCPDWARALFRFDCLVMSPSVVRARRLVPWPVVSPSGPFL